jgi:hypothetical protein
MSRIPNTDLKYKGIGSSVFSTVHRYVTEQFLPDFSFNYDSWAEPTGSKVSNVKEGTVFSKENISLEAMSLLRICIDLAQLEMDGETTTSTTKKF